MKLLLFAGAGTSIELGVPGMVGLAEEFLDHAEQWSVEPQLVSEILTNELDVEVLIEKLDHVCSAGEALASLGLGDASLARLDKIRAEVEWFVQHAAERVVARDARLMWGSVLRATAGIDLTLITTNYDRAIELAANAEHVDLDDGFGPFEPSETALWVGFAEGTHFVKLHGSTDWYSEGEGVAPVKLAHPMPLFGRASLELASGKKLHSALVLPSREKLLTREPYPRLSQRFLNAVDDCDVAIFVGSSLRDFHIKGAAEQTAKRVPLFIVNPEGSSHGVDNAKPIQQCASTFLISTLPNALASPDVAVALENAVNRGRVRVDAGILSVVRAALDSDLSVAQRCDALEQLDDAEVPLDPSFVRKLLDDEHSQVARYCLGLIPFASGRRVLIEEAAKSRHLGEPSFRADFDLLGASLAEPG